MNLLKLLDLLDLNLVDQDEYKKPALRRDLFRKAGDYSLKAALAAVPFALTALPNIVKAQSSSTVNALNFALTLEYLEDEFYRLGLGATGLIPTGDRAVFSQIGLHEREHVSFLRTALGNAAVSKPTFDFTARGAFADVFTNYQTFIALAQAFEDTGVRAYKGQTGNVMTDKNILEAALQIHSVEARHAAQVRRMRGMLTNQPIKGWIVNSEANGLPAAIYAGEDNLTHAGANLNSITSLNSISAATKAEAFDEILSREQVTEIITPFLV